MKTLLLGFSLLVPAFAAAPPPRPPELVAATLCAACHGPNLTGGSGPNLLDSRWNHGGEDGAVLRSIRDGWPASGMPPFRDALAPEEQRAVLEFLRRQAAEFAAGRIKPPPPPPAEPIESEQHTFRVETVADSLDTPWGMAFLPDGRILVTERPGRLRVIEHGQLAAAPVSGIPAVFYHQDGGLLDVIAHPDFAKNGWIYLAYSEAGKIERTSMTVVVRGRIRDGAWTDQETIFRADPRHYSQDTSHYGCRFLFDAGRRLYFTIGERGSPDEAQDLSSPLGKIHRVIDDGSVPPDNPFVGRPGALGSIWSYGHRHPQGLQFHPVTGQLWATEHGPIGGDELNVIEAGRNYGWPIVSRGTAPNRTFLAERADLVAPIVSWTPAIAPSGIAFYTGDRFPRWKNQLFVAGLIGQQLRRLELEGNRVVRQEVLFKGQGRVRAVATGPDGLLYVAFNEPADRIARLVPVDAGAALAAKGEARPAVRRGVFGRTPDGIDVESFVLANKRGATAKVITFGAILAELRMPDSSGVVSGVVQEVIPSAKGFETGFPKAAAIFGRVVNRIAHARFTLDGREFRLAANAAPHHIHGGTRGFNRVLWRAEAPNPAGAASVRLTYVSVDGEEGYPGTLTATATYTLTDDNVLRLEFTATTDRPTPVNLTNHAFFNLGNGGDVVNHEFLIDADAITVVDAKRIPTGELSPVRGTPFDFTRSARLGARASLLGPPPIYDHNFVLNRPAGDSTLRFAARVFEPESGRQMEVWTTEPGLQLYTSELSERPIAGRVGFFCIETQHFPDAVNHPGFPSTILRPGEIYRSTTEYRFSAK